MGATHTPGPSANRQIRMTTREIGKDHERTAERSQPLWKSAHAHIAHICATYHRARARRMCRFYARKFSAMAISGVYESASKQLR